MKLTRILKSYYIKRLNNNTGHLVAGRRPGSPQAGVVEMQVAAADTAREQAHPHFTECVHGNRNAPDLDQFATSRLRGPHGRRSARHQDERSITARTTSGQAMVASAKTSAKRPPSLSGTNLPQETPSL